MKLEGRITFLINRDNTYIEIEDHNSATSFVRIKLNPDQLSALLSRQAHVECELNITGLERVGKKHENKYHEFEIPEHLSSYDRDEEELHKLAQSGLTDGWVADKYFGSQNSFFKKDGKNFARVVIRRYV